LNFSDEGVINFFVRNRWALIYNSHSKRWGGICPPHQNNY
jgi:hypothetical protein